MGRLPLSLQIRIQCPFSQRNWLRESKWRMKTPAGMDGDIGNSHREDVPASYCEDVPSIPAHWCAFLVYNWTLWCSVLFCIPVLVIWDFGCSHFILSVVLLIHELFAFSPDLIHLLFIASRLHVALP